MLASVANCTLQFPLNAGSVSVIRLTSSNGPNDTLPMQNQLLVIKLKKRICYITRKNIFTLRTSRPVEYMGCDVYVCFHQLSPLGRVGLVVTKSVYLFICPLSMQFFSRPLIGPQVT